MLYIKLKKSVLFCLTTAVPLPHGCWIRGMVVFVSEVATKQDGAVKRPANHISEDMQSGQSKVECFMQCRMELKKLPYGEKLWRGETLTNLANDHQFSTFKLAKFYASNRFRI